MPNLLPSITRTLVPLIVGWLIALGLRAGFDWDDYSDEMTTLITVAVTGLYYIVVRFLETNASSQFGWLLGLANPPRYVAPTAPVNVQKNEYDVYREGDDQLS